MCASDGQQQRYVTCIEPKWNHTNYGFLRIRTWENEATGDVITLAVTKQPITIPSDFEPVWKLTSSLTCEYVQDFTPLYTTTYPREWLITASDNVVSELNIGSSKWLHRTHRYLLASQKCLHFDHTNTKSVILRPNRPTRWAIYLENGTNPHSWLYLIHEVGNFKVHVLSLGPMRH